MIRLDNLTADFTSLGERRPFGMKVRALLSRSYRALVAAQEARAKAIVQPYLARHDDQVLFNLGFNAEEIKVIRRQADREPRLWY
jgi:hypothetical protein